MIFHRLTDASDTTRPYTIVAKDKILFAELHPQADHTVHIHIAFAGHADLVIEKLTKDEAHSLLNDLGNESVLNPG